MVFIDFVWTRRGGTESLFPLARSRRADLLCQFGSVPSRMLSAATSTHWDDVTRFMLKSSLL